jgi:hypothetical protein
MVSSPIDPALVGGGSDAAAIELTAEAEASSLPSVPATSEIAPLDPALDLLVRWFRANADALSPLTLVFPRAPRAVLEHLQGVRHRAFKPDAHHLLRAGRVFVCSRSLGEAVENDADFSSASDVFTGLEALGLAQEPTIIVIPAQGSAYWYPSGMSTPDEHRTLPLSVAGTAVVSESVIDSFLDLHYNQHLKTPMAGTKVWEDASLYVPVLQAEKAVQYDLWIAAKTAFAASHRVRLEDPTPAGRTDVLITNRPDVSEARGAALLELKVLRSMHHHVDPRRAKAFPESENRAGIEKGLSQAHSYGNEQGCDLTFLCLFDMRKDNSDEIVAPFRPNALSLGVLLRRYFLFASSDAARASDTARVLSEPGAAESTPGRGKSGRGKRRSGKKG